MANFFSKLFGIKAKDEEKEENEQAEIDQDEKDTGDPENQEVYETGEEELIDTLPNSYVEEPVNEEVKVDTTEIVTSEIDTIQVDKAEENEGKGFFGRLKEGLFKTRKNISDKVNNMLAAFTVIDEDLFEELEEILIMSDVGVATTLKIIEGLKDSVKKERITDPQAIKGLLKKEIVAIMGNDRYTLGQYSPEIILVIGVNGVGKTTSIGKIANRLKKQNKKVVIAAADTFRAAAIDQLEIWAKRSNVDIIKHADGGDPAAVIYDSINSAKSKKADVVICDTAGRLHNKKNLMDELNKIFRIVDREYPEAHRETWLVLDATTGQNAISQAKLFKEVADITGIILTKLDGTAKGGIVIAIKSELGIPVKLIGVGEQINDLQDFNAENFVEALFS